MEQFIKITLSGMLAVIVFDTLGALASHSFGFAYQNLTVGSFLIYCAIGFIASRYNGLLYGVLAAGLTSLVDATAGWYISWMIGPGRPAVEMTSSDKISTVIFVTITGAVIGLIGGFLALATRRKI